MKEDIFENSGIPQEFIDFFRGWQKHVAGELNDGEQPGYNFYGERNGRFASNFRYHMLDGLKKDIEEDLLVAAAILFSHHASYISNVFDKEDPESISRLHEVEKIKETVKKLAEYMSKNGVDIYACGKGTFYKARAVLGLEGKCIPSRAKKIRIASERYYTFFCELAEILGYEENNVCSDGFNLGNKT